MPSLALDTAVGRLGGRRRLRFLCSRRGDCPRGRADAKLLLLLVPQVGEPSALGAAVVLRLVWVVAELAISAILYFALEGNADAVDRHPRSE